MQRQGRLAFCAALQTGDGSAFTVGTKRNDKGFFSFAEAARQPLSCVVVSRLNEFLGVTGQWVAQLDYISVSGRDSPIRGDFQLWGPQANSTR